jgi:hypothetical protein
MGPDIKLVIALQNLDARIGELQLEISALPKHISAIERTLESHIRKLEADQAALAANQRERKKLDDDIKVQNQKTSKLKDQMMEAKTNEQYRAFQHEIDYGLKEIRKAEDRILDLMAESEPLEQNLRKAELALKDEKVRVEAEKKATRERTAKDKQELDVLSAERRQLVAELNPQVYSAYDRIRKKRRGVAVAEAVDGRCGACHMALRPQFFQDLRASEQVMFCESCGRILYYNPVIVVEPDMSAEAGTEPPQ